MLNPSCSWIYLTIKCSPCVLAINHLPKDLKNLSCNITGKVTAKFSFILELIVYSKHIINYQNQSKWHTTISCNHLALFCWGKRVKKWMRDIISKLWSQNKRSLNFVPCSYYAQQRQEPIDQMLSLVCMPNFTNFSFELSEPNPTSFYTLANSFFCPTKLQSDVER